MFWCAKKDNKGTYANLSTEIFSEKMTQKYLYTQTAHAFSRTVLFARKDFTNFYTTCFFLTKKNTKKHAQQFLQTDVFYTENVPDKNLTHKRFYAQNLLDTDAFTHRCLDTGTNYTQKFAHTARFYTQPTFKQSGFASPS